jgi:hypothetical protein
MLFRPGVAVSRAERVAYAGDGSTNVTLASLAEGTVCPMRVVRELRDWISKAMVEPCTGPGELNRTFTR